VEPDAAICWRSSRRAPQVRFGHCVEPLVASKPAHVWDVLPLERIQERGCREPRIRPEPHLWEEATKPLDDWQHELKAAGGRMGVSRTKMSTEEEPAVNARNERMIAAYLVVTVVRALFLMPMHLVRLRVHVQRDLIASSKERPGQRPQDRGEARAVRSRRQHLEETGDRRLRTEPVRLTSLGSAKRSIATPFGHRQAE